MFALSRRSIAAVDPGKPDMKITLLSENSILKQYEILNIILTSVSDIAILV